MITLKNVSKFYYKKGIIASGISKVNLELDMGEFVVITGESGSGKSTLLNVISGIDTYEEGELLIGGKETSHFMEQDWADYRKRYIGNVFQNFNLINSYTVYQNIELALMINGHGSKDIKARVNDIIDKVGLTKFAKTKASKLSGGQKQRVAIARALAKETDIIVADEPTGNLDSTSATEIVKLLHEISRDKLVIVVTHNYEQFAPYVSRKIKMHDGRIVEDVKVNELAESEHPARKRMRGSGKISALGKLRLGIRNTFNVLPKFVLLLIVFGFVCTAVTSQYTSYLSQKEEANSLGYNSYFQNLTLDRMVLKKADGSKFTNEDYEAIRDVYNVKTVAEYDILLDAPIFFGDDDFYIDAAPRSIDEFKGKLILGRMPAKSNEVLLAANRNDASYDEKRLQQIVNREFQVTIGNNGNTVSLVVVGVANKKMTDDLNTMSDAYLANDTLDNIMAETYHNHSKLEVKINGKAQTVESGEVLYNLIPSSKVEEGEAIAPEEASNFYKDGKATGKTIKIRVKNIYYEKNKELEVKKVYSKKNYSSVTGFNKDTYDYMGGLILVSQKDYNKLFTSNNYQVSVYVQDKDSIDETKATLEKMGYVGLPLKDALVTIISDVLAMIQLPISIIVVIALFFIAFFVIRLILRSRTGYFSVLRMLGMDMKAMRRIMDIELLLVMTIAFAIFAGVAMASSHGYINVEYISNMVKYLEPMHYGILYAVLLVMSYMISGKFSKSLFKKSAIGTYKEVE